jgi:protein-disulfide isomerase
MADKRAGAPRGRSGAAKAKQGNRKGFYVLLIVVAVLGIATLGYVTTKQTNDRGALSQVDSTLPKVQSEGYVMGSPTAPIEVVEFGDFECPTCARFAELVEPDVRRELVNTGKIRFRFIDFPLPMHGNTWQASRCAACADEQGKFWEMHDKLFATQDQWNAQATNDPDKKFRVLAAQITGLDTKQFEECVKSRRMQAKIQAHEALAVARKANGTPTFFAGGLSWQYVNFDQFKVIVDSAIKLAGPGKKLGDTAVGRAMGDRRGGL